MSSFEVDPDGELEAMTITELLEVQDEAEVHAEQDRTGRASATVRYIDRMIETRMAR